MSVTLRTTCGAELWAGFFGIDCNGNQPECGHEFEIEVEEESVEIDKHGDIRVCFGIECPVCKTLLEWPQVWEIVSFR